MNLHPKFLEDIGAAATASDASAPVFHDNYIAGRENEHDRG